METATLVWSFAVGVLVSAAVVHVFAAAIDEAISRALPGELGGIWTRFAKFALFVASIASGLRIGQPVGTGAQGGGMEAGGHIASGVVRTVIGCLQGAAWMLLVVFGAALAIHAGRRLYDARRESLRLRGIEEARHAEKEGAEGSRRPERSDRTERKHGDGRVPSGGGGGGLV
jgi:hypothetical protein